MRPTLRSRWAAIGAAVAVTIGAGGLLPSALASTTQGSGLTPVVPCRLADTRPSNPFGAGETRTFTATGDQGACSVPTTATAIQANFTLVRATAATFVTAYPSGTSLPLASTVNLGPGESPRANSGTVKLSETGAFDVYNDAGDVHVVIDITGYYASLASGGGPAGPAGPEGPAGPAGPEGPAGPAGIGGITYFETWRGEGTAAFVACPQGTKPVSAHPYAVQQGGGNDVPVPIRVIPQPIFDTGEETVSGFTFESYGAAWDYAEFNLVCAETSDSTASNPK